MSKAKTLYVGCSITHSPKEALAQVNKFKSDLSDMGYKINDFFDLSVDVTPAEVYRHDIERCIRTSDGFIAICDHPSTGLGFELGEAANLNKPVLLLVHKDTHLTRLIIGAAEVLPNFELVRYDSFDEGVMAIAEKWLAKL